MNDTKNIRTRNSVQAEHERLLEPEAVNCTQERTEKDMSIYKNNDTVSVALQLQHQSPVIADIATITTPHTFTTSIVIITKPSDITTVKTPCIRHSRITIITTPCVRHSRHCHNYNPNRSHRYKRTKP